MELGRLALKELRVWGRRQSWVEVMAYSGLWGTSGGKGVPGQLGEPGKVLMIDSKQSVLDGGEEQVPRSGHSRHGAFQTV